jgi:hypothetical protein
MLIASDFGQRNTPQAAMVVRGFFDLSNIAEKTP